MQTVTVEYIVRGPLDGTTPAPAVVVQPNAGGDRPNIEDQIYRKEVEALGIIDPSLIGGATGSFGMRYVPFIWIDAADPGDAGAQLDLVAVREDGTVVQQQELASLQGQQRLYLPLGAMVPQGSALRVSGLPEGASETTVRLTLMVPESVADVARILEIINITIGVGEFAFDARQWSVPNDGNDAAPAINAMLQEASVAGQRTRRNQRVLLPTGDYTYATDIEIPANVEIWGEGPSTRLLQSGAAEIRFATGFLRSSLQDIAIQGDTDAPTGVGLDMNTTRNVRVSRVQVWDFATGILLNDGTPFSAYNTIGPGVEVNRCATGIRALSGAHVNYVVGSRVWFSFTPGGTGIGVDIDDASGITFDGCAFESCDTCVRVRSTDGFNLQAVFAGNFFEPGTNPDTAQAGNASDIDLLGADLSQIHGFGNRYSALRARALIEPASLSKWDGPQRESFGARFDGAAQPRRNYVYNGAFFLFNASNIPNVSSTSAPTIASDPLFVTGNRSLRVTATSTLSRLNVGFVQPDQIEWMTVGVRYQVLSGTGFSITAVSGANTANWVDTETSGGAWRIAYLTVRRDTSVTGGTVRILPDNVDGTGVCLIDEVWVYAGRYAADSVPYAERVTMLPAMLPIYDQTRTGNAVIPSINLLTLPATLAPPFDAFCTAPPNIVGAVLRLSVVTDSGAFGTALASFHRFTLDVQGSNPPLPPLILESPAPAFSQCAVNMDYFNRATTVSGSVNAGDGVSTRYRIWVQGWIHP